MIDLHTHSTCSDGSEAPESVVELAAAAGCSALALTDHDTLAGLPSARRRAAELGVRFVPGLEIACAFGASGAHVLIYFVEEGVGPLADELVRLRADRVARNHRLADRLATLGLPVTYEAALSRAASEESLGRPHFAQVLVESGAATDVSDAFDRFLASGRPGYVAKDRLTPAEAAAVARSSGAVAVLAHPMTLGLSIGALGAAVGELAEAGLVGLEAYYGRYTPQVRIGLAQLAQRTGLVATGGSDFHGLAKPELSVGTGTGDLSVPDRALEQLEARRAELSRH